MRPILPIFDFDGTLADTLRHAHGILNELAARHGFRPLSEEELPMAKDMTAKQLARYLKVSKLKIPSLLMEGRVILGERMGEIQPVPGVESVVPELRDRVNRLGIITSNSHDNVSAFLKLHKMEHFEFISPVPKLGGKARNILAVAKTFGVEPKDIFYIGDEIRDVKAAAKAGCRSVAVSWGFNSRRSLERLKPDHLLDEPKQLLDALSLD